MSWCHCIDRFITIDNMETNSSPPRFEWWNRNTCRYYSLFFVNILATYYAIIKSRDSKQGYHCNSCRLHKMIFNRNLIIVSVRTPSLLSFSSLHVNIWTTFNTIMIPGFRNQISDWSSQQTDCEIIPFTIMKNHEKINNN